MSSLVNLAMESEILILLQAHANDEYAKNDETSPRLAKKYENCAS